MTGKYLHGDPLPWLLEESDPCVRYLARRDILGDKPDDEYGAVLDSPEVQALCKGNVPILGNSAGYDIFYKGTLWCFCKAVALGMDKRSGILDKTADHIARNWQSSSGGIRPSWEPGVESAYFTGDVVRSFISAGYDDDRVTRGVRWIMENQRHDGGWLHSPVRTTADLFRLILFNRAGNGLVRDADPVIASCPYASISCAAALTAYREIGGGECGGAVTRAADFFLESKLYRFRNRSIFNSRLIHGQDFRLLGYPVLGQYDVLHGLLFLARAGALNDPRTSEAFNTVMAKQNADGSWDLESAATGMLQGDRTRGSLGRKNKWVTLNALRLLRFVE